MFSKALTVPANPQELPLCPLECCYAKCGLGTSSIGFARELGNAERPAFSQTYGVGICMPVDVHAH